MSLNCSSDSPDEENDSVSSCSKSLNHVLRREIEKHLNESLPKETKQEKPKKVKRKLKITLRREVQKELNAELCKERSIQDKIDRANTQFNMKVLETLKRAVKEDKQTKKNLESLKQERAQKMIQNKYNHCVAKLLAAKERQLREEAESIIKMKQRQENIEKRLKKYKKQWKKMDTLKKEYQIRGRKEMKAFPNCKNKAKEKKPNVFQQIVKYYQDNLVKFERPAQLNAETDMVKLVIHIIARRFVHDAVSHILCFLLTETEQCILNMSPTTVVKLNKSGTQISPDLVNTLLEAGRLKFKPNKPPANFLSNMLKTFSPTQTSEPTSAPSSKPCPLSQYELQWPCAISTPSCSEISIAVEEVEESEPFSSKPSAATIRSLSTASVLTSMSGQSSTSINSSLDFSHASIGKSLTNVDFNEHMPEQPATPQTDDFDVEYSSSSASLDCDTISLSISDDSIRNYFEKYNTSPGQICEPNQTKYMIQDSVKCNAKSTEPTPEMEHKSQLCVHYRTMRKPLSSTKLFELLANYNSVDEGENSLCHDEIIADKVTVPEIIHIQKIKPQVVEDPETVKPDEVVSQVAKKSSFTRASNQSKSSKSKSLESVDESSSELDDDVTATFYLYNSLKFLSTTVLDILCELTSHTRPPVDFQFSQFERFATIEGFEDFIDGLFEENFDLINNDGLILFILMFYFFAWMIPNKILGKS